MEVFIHLQQWILLFIPIHQLALKIFCLLYLHPVAKTQQNILFILARIQLLAYQPVDLQHICVYHQQKLFLLIQHEQVITPLERFIL